MKGIDDAKVAVALLGLAEHVYVSNLKRYTCYIELKLLAICYTPSHQFISTDTTVKLGAKREVDLLSMVVCATSQSPVQFHQVMIA